VGELLAVVGAKAADQGDGGRGLGRASMVAMFFVLFFVLFLFICLFMFSFDTIECASSAMRAAVGEVSV